MTSLLQQPLPPPLRGPVPAAITSSTEALLTHQQLRQPVSLPWTVPTNPSCHQACCWLGCCGQWATRQLPAGSSRRSWYTAVLQKHGIVRPSRRVCLGCGAGASAGARYKCSTGHAAAHTTHVQGLWLQDLKAGDPRTTHTVWLPCSGGKRSPGAALGAAETMPCRFVLLDQLLVREVLPPPALQLLTSTLASLGSLGAASPGAADGDQAAAGSPVPQQAALLIIQVPLLLLRPSIPAVYRVTSNKLLSSAPSTCPIPGACLPLHIAGIHGILLSKGGWPSEKPVSSAVSRVKPVKPDWHGCYLDRLSGCGM